MMWQAYFVAYRVKYATAQHVADAQICERVTIELLMSENLAYIKNKKRGSRERSPPPCQIKTLILPRCPEALGNIGLDLTLTRKFFELSGHAARSSRIASTHHQTVFEPPFMTASARH